MAESRDDGSIAPRRGLGGPILPPPPPALAADARKAEAAARKAEADARRAAADKADAKRAESEKQEARRIAQTQKAEAKQAKAEKARSEKEERRARPPRETKRPAPDKAPAKKKSAPRTRRAQLRLVQIDAWSVMKTAFLLSIALGIVLVVAVAIIWSVLGQAGVWESINSIVQQAVGSENGDPFDIEEYAGTSRVLGFTMIVAVFDVIFITAIATLGAFLYNLSAALLGGIEVTLAEDN